ncbi:MAG: helix-turn-helix transcriptional regulator [Pelistega sp.]|nr:helix-turn-helix transcriptional regulator [Pelistega sp.]
MNLKQHTILKTDGKPAFVILPYDDYLVLCNKKQTRIPVDGTIPHEVISLQVNNDWSIIRAWREYLGITQIEMAQRLKVRQPTYANIEARHAKPRRATIERVAEALNISIEQLA